MRVYLPATSAMLSALRDTAVFGSAPVTAFAVTPGLREWYVDDDIDELEYAASGQAARASIRLIDADPQAVRRRVVISADVADDQITVHDDLERGAVRVATSVPLSAVAAFHVDDADAEPTVAVAAAVVLEADLGSESGQEAQDDVEGFELDWYAPTELDQLIASLTGER